MARNGDVGDGETGDRGDKRGDHVHERGGQQSVAGEHGDERRSQESRFRREASREDPVGEEQTDRAEHGDRALLGPDPPAQRSEHHHLADQRAAIPVLEMNLAGPGEDLRDLAVGPGVVVGDGEVVGREREEVRDADGKENESRQGHASAPTRPGRDHLRRGPEFFGAFG